MSTRQASSSDTASATYCTRQLAINAQMEELLTLLIKHRPSGEIHWGHVGDLAHVSEKLAEIIHFLMGDK